MLRNLDLGYQTYNRISITWLKFTGHGQQFITHIYFSLKNVHVAKGDLCQMLCNPMHLKLKEAKALSKTLTVKQINCQLKFLMFNF